jgi:hypothetical protein
MKSRAKTFTFESDLVGSVWYDSGSNEIWLCIQNYSPYPEHVFETPAERRWHIHNDWLNKWINEGRLEFLEGGEK